MTHRILHIDTGGTIVSDRYADGYSLKNPPQFVATLKTDRSQLAAELNALPNHELVDEFSWGKWAKTLLGQVGPARGDKLAYDHIDALSWGAWAEDRFIKDSQEYNDGDIRELARIILGDAEHDCFLITHGTSAMVANARKLQALLKDSRKVVVFTGAMSPLSMQENRDSDAIETLRMVLKTIVSKEPGTYIAGYDPATRQPAFFNPSEVEKDADLSLDHLEFTLKPRSR